MSDVIRRGALRGGTGSRKTNRGDPGANPFYAVTPPSSGVGGSLTALPGFVESRLRFSHRRPCMSRLLLAALFFLNAPLFAAEPAIPRAKQYQAFVKKQAAALRQGDKPPATLDELNRRNAELRKNLLAAWGR